MEKKGSKHSDGHQMNKVIIPCPSLGKKNKQEVGLPIIKKEHLSFDVSNKKKTREQGL